MNSHQRRKARRARMRETLVEVRRYTKLGIKAVVEIPRRKGMPSSGWGEAFKPMPGHDDLELAASLPGKTTVLEASVRSGARYAINLEKNDAT